MKNWLIHILGGYTSSEYEWYRAENMNLRTELRTANDKIEDLKHAASVKFTIAVDGGKVWIE